MKISLAFLVLLVGIKLFAQNSPDTITTADNSIF